MHDLNVHGVPADATIEQLGEAIEKRKALIRTLVGNLYPRILQAEIDKLCVRRDRERLRRPLDAEREEQGA